jgi:predicted DNA-binding protein (UPF0251 family)
MHNIFVNQRALAHRDGQGVSIDAGEDGGVVWQISVRPTQQARVELIEIMHEIERLPAEQREVLLLAAVEELRYEEIATVLGIPIGTVMSRLSRARARLRRIAVEPGVGAQSGSIVRQPESHREWRCFRKARPSVEGRPRPCVSAQPRHPDTQD